MVKDLQERDLLNASEKYEHEYPFCWRCDAPLLYHATTSWFIKMSELRDDLIANNNTVHWVPEHIQKGRFGEWLDGIKDWAISRDRFWGTPIPIWICEECTHKVCIGSLQALQDRGGEPKNAHGSSICIGLI